MFSKAEIDKIKAHVAHLKPSIGGLFSYYCIPFRKKVVLKNMRQVFGSVLSDAEIHKLALCFYSHVFTSLKENLMLRFMSEGQIRKRAIVIGAENLLKLDRDKVKGAIVITGHFGNWEFAPIAGILNFKEFQGRLYVVRKTLGVKFLEKLLFRRYYKAGLKVISKKNSLMKVCDALDTYNAVMFVMDQHASIKAKDGIMVDFFGKPAGTFKSPATIARYTKLPVLAVRAYRQKDGIHVLQFSPPFQWISKDDPKEEVYANTRTYNQFLEQCILEYPEQWLWMHKRWKTT